MLKSEFKKMSAIQFKQALCMELLRCESVVKETLPSVLKVSLVLRLHNQIANLSGLCPNSPNSPKSPNSPNKSMPVPLLTTKSMPAS